MVRWPALIVPDQPEPHPEHVGPDVGTEDYDEPIQDHSEGEQAQGQEPEPDEDVDLFIDCNIVSVMCDMCVLSSLYLIVTDVERQDAEHVMILNVARGPILVESAFCHSELSRRETVKTSAVTFIEWKIISQ